jgi:uncharacterized protein YbjT (DUF2867 family)
MQQVLVAGGAGALGAHVVRLLKARGYWVRVLTRRRERAGALGADEVVVADATRPETLAGVCRDVDVVVSSLGQSVSPRFDCLRPGYHAVDYVGNHALLQQAREAKVGRFVYVSVFGAYESARGAYLKAHADIGREVRQSGLGYAIVEPTGFFSAYRAFFNLARSGTAVLLGDGRARTNPIHDADLAEVCVEAVASHEEGDVPAGGPDTLTRREVFELAFAALDRKPRIFRAPAGMPGLLGTLMHPFAPRPAELMEFVGHINRSDAVAPVRGTRRLADHYRDLADAPLTPD